mmetsp:Transcript_4519/g.6688  ORF Transcript_4519/g.6688 Transcript_4519/m.6688 type:complete len:236 (-) Transcript_4519:1816-2523(-)
MIVTDVILPYLAHSSSKSRRISSSQPSSVSSSLLNILCTKRFLEGSPPTFLGSFCVIPEVAAEAEEMEGATAIGALATAAAAGVGTAGGGTATAAACVALATAAAAAVGKGAVIAPNAASRAASATLVTASWAVATEGVVAVGTAPVVATGTGTPCTWASAKCALEIRVGASSGNASDVRSSTPGTDDDWFAHPVFMGRPTKICPAIVWMARFAHVGSLNCKKANPRARPVVGSF